MVGNLLYDNTRYVYTAINTFRNFIVSKRKNVVHLCMVGKKSWSCLWTPNIGGNFLSLIIFPIMAVHLHGKFLILIMRKTPSKQARIFLFWVKVYLSQ